MRFLVLVLFFTFLSCGAKDDATPEILKAQDSDYIRLVNSKRISKKEENKDKFILNNKYHRGKIKIYLYNDGKFFYDFENLGKGNGSWFIDEGIMYLKSKFDWIPLNFEIFLGQKSPDVYYMRFIDSRGSRVQSIQVGDK